MPGAPQHEIPIRPAAEAKQAVPIVVEKINPVVLNELAKDVDKNPRKVLEDVSELGGQREEKNVPTEELKNNVFRIAKEINLGQSMGLSYIGEGATGKVYKLTVLKNGKECYMAVKIGKDNHSVSDEQFTLIKIKDAETHGKYSLTNNTAYTVERFGGDTKKNISIMEYIPISEETSITDNISLENLSIAIQYAHDVFLLRQAGLANIDFKIENLHNIHGRLRVTDVGLVSDKEETLKSTNQIKGVLRILGQSVSPNFSDKVFKLIRATNNDLIPYTQYSQKKQYEIGEIIRSEEFKEGPVEIRGLVLKTLNLLRQEKTPEQMVSKEGYEELLIDIVALGSVESINLPKALNGIEKRGLEKRVDKLEKYELPTLETSNETKMSPEAIKKLEVAFVQSLPKRININNIQYLLTNDEQKKALYESILIFSSHREGDTNLQEGLIPNFETFITELRALDDPKKIGIDDELIATQYSAMRSIILGLNGKQSSDFSPEDITLIKTRMEAIKKGGSKEEVEELLKEITGKIEPPSTNNNSTPLISKSKSKA